MRYVSTRGQTDPLSFTEALVSGLASDGGLLVPESLPSLPQSWVNWSYQEAMVGSLELFGASDVGELVVSAASRFNHSEIAPIVDVRDRLILELFWGPTLSFKDHALQIVARLLDREIGRGTILGATSGDTGAAAIEAVRGSESLDIVILFPEGRVSEFQRRQMTTVPDSNVTVVAVRGTFDDCQALVKDAFAANHDLLAINSINWARIAAQVGFYIYAGARIGEVFDLAVPTGNFGNVFSAWTAKQMGVPIEVITIANNANHGLADLVTDGTMRPANVVATLAPSMDIQIPSNLERFTGDPSAEFVTGWSTDNQIRETIAEVHQARGYQLDPHTATAWRAGSITETERPQLVVATAHPAKFNPEIAQPSGYPNLIRLPERVVTIGNDPSDLKRLLR